MAASFRTVIGIEIASVPNGKQEFYILEFGWRKLIERCCIKKGANIDDQIFLRLRTNHKK